MPEHRASTYPTPQHARAAEVITAFFVEHYEIESVLLTNSCARGKATRDSCLDLAILARPDWLSANLAAAEQEWEEFASGNEAIQALRATGKFSHVHLGFVDGVFTPTEQDEAAPPDSFEVSIGNIVVYSAPLWERDGYSGYLEEIRRTWLPYYNEDLRRQRLTSVRWFCLNNLHHIPLYVERGLYFQSLDRLHNAHQEFLQALFIARRTYPIAYNKWVREQVVDILGLPDLYPRLTQLFEIKSFESTQLADKARVLEQLLEHYAPAP
jgi:predicted nucleotidyltransferase